MAQEDKPPEARHPKEKKLKALGTESFHPLAINCAPSRIQTPHRNRSPSSVSSPHNNMWISSSR